MRVFIYLRVSTDDQEDNTSIEQQDIDCTEYCDENGHKVVGVFRDVWTGSVWRERKGFMEMRARYLKGEADAVLVRTYSRFTRMIADYFILTQEMKDHGVKLLCVKEQYDDTPLGRMLQAVQMGFNEQERETTRQRTMDGKRARVVNQNKYLASTKPPYGFQFDDPVIKAKLLAYEPEARIVRWIVDQRVGGRSIIGITRDLIAQKVPAPKGGVWDKRAVQRIIANCEYLYRGIGVAFKTHDERQMRDGKVIKVRVPNKEEDMIFLPQGTVERIVLDEVAFKALAIREAILQDNPRANFNPEAALLRGGFVKCGWCEYTMVTTKVARLDYPYYECSGPRRPQKDCVSNLIKGPTLDEAIWAYAIEVARTIGIFEEAIQKVIGQDTLQKAEESALQCIADCDTLVEQYQQDLKKKDWKAATRMFLLEEMEKQLEIRRGLQEELKGIREGRIDHKRLKAELQDLLDWCARVKMGDETEPSWKEKRNHLRMLGIVAYVYPKRDNEHERYEFRIAPKGLLDILNATSPKAKAPAGALGDTHPHVRHHIAYLFKYTPKLGTQFYVSPNRY